MLRLKIPKKLKTLARTWRVKKSSTLAAKYGLSGLCVEDTRYISIDKNQSEEEMALTFVHEGLLHAIFPKGVCSANMEEKIVLALEPELYYILTHNKLIQDIKKLKQKKKK